MVPVIDCASQSCVDCTGDVAGISRSDTSQAAEPDRKALLRLAAGHAALGGVAEFAGMYILLAAGTEILPEKFRIKRYEVWMRSVLVVWWMVLFLGIATYARWYVIWR